MDVHIIVIGVSATPVLDHLKWRLVQQMAGNYVTSIKPIGTLKWLCLPGYVHMQY